MGSEMQARVAEAMRTRREELIAQPLARVWDELALAAMRAMREPTEGAVEYGKSECSNVYDIDEEGIEQAWLDMMDYEIKKAEEG